jgi:uncharacterized Zn finger protein (UPF0148 family)
MLQGYTLKETQCEKCGMPMMEYNDVLDCVVCPALIKKAKKKLKEQQRLAEQKARMDQAIQMAKEQKALEHAEAQLAAANAQRALQNAQAAEEEGEWLIMQAQEEEAARIASLEAEEKRLLAEARARAEDEARIRAQEEEARILEDMKYGSLSVEQSNSGSKLKEEDLRRTEELAILAETKRLERMENDRAASKMRRDLLLQEERKLMSDRSLRDIEIQRMEKLRMEELLEQKLQEEERRMHEESALLMSLEQEASDKARAAEEAIEKAKIALASVSSARKDIIAQTIALAEAEAIAEAEGIIMADREDYKSPIVLPTQEDLMRENWETLRQEGRSIMTRRVMAGWTLLPEFCRGKECEHSPLVALEDKKECVICGGSGNGMDGAYLNKTRGNDEEDDDKGEHDAELEQICDESTIPTQYTPYTQNTASRSFTTTPAHEYEALAMATETRAVASPTANRSVQELQDDFEAKRNMVSKEIGKRMIQGWTLLDMSCPNCVMPLMSDTEGHGEICVLCGLISRIVEPDHSTMQSKDSEGDEYQNITRDSEGDEDQNITRDGSREDSQDAIGSDDDTPTTNHIESTDMPFAPTSSGNQEVLLQSISVSTSEDKGSLSEQIRKYAQTPTKADPPGPTAKVQKRVSTDPDETSYKPDASEGNDYHESIEVSRDDISIARTNDEVFTISFPKDFDFSDEKAFLAVMSAKQREFAPKAKVGFSTDVVSFPVMDTNTIPATAEIITVDDAMTQEAMASMFSESAEGYKASELIESGNMDEVVDLAESFMRKNFGSEPVNGLTQKELVTELVQNFTTATYRDDEVKEIPNPDHVDEIEQCRSPMEWSVKTPTRPKSTFDFVDLPRHVSSNDAPELDDNVSTNSQISRRRPRITPESMDTRSRSKKEAVEAPGSRGAPFPSDMQSPARPMPPRPDSSARSLRSYGSRYGRPPVTSVGRRRKNASSPRKGGVLVIGGPSEGDYEPDNISLGEVSRAETVATQTLDSLLNRIEECKTILLDPRSDYVKQAETARLIEQLASAAMAVKKLEAMAF